MYLPSNSTIAETCEWLQCETGQQWSLPRLLEEGHLTPYVWIDYVEGLPLIFGNRLEGFLTKMAYHGDVIRLAADRNDALLTMFTGHDGALIRPKPGWRVELKHIRFQKPDIERVAEIINKQKTAPAQTPPVETVEQRRTRYLALFEAEEIRDKRGALQRVADSEGVDRSNLKKDIDKARAARDSEKRAGSWASQLVTDGKRKG